MSLEPSAPGIGRRAGPKVHAAGPAQDLEALRRGYLDLLKLCLCDLVGQSTTSVRGLQRGRVASRELTGEDLSLRAEGRDWPAHGLTMTGLRRLDDLQGCVESIVADDVEGDLIEVGCWRGGASILMRATLDTLGARERTVWAADSFHGFPHITERPDGDGEQPVTVEPYLAVFDFLAAPLDDVRANFDRLGLTHGTRFLPGFFEETLPGLHEESWALVRLDADTYESTLLALRCLYPRLAKGGFLIVDDYDALEECRAAVDRFREEHEIGEPLERVDWTCVRWRRESDAPIETSPPMPVTRAARDVVPARHRGRIPSEQELEVAGQLADVRERLAETERELAATRGELHGITASTSWRVTKPLREIGARLRQIGSGSQ